MCLGMTGVITEVRDDDGVPMAVVGTDSAAAVTACLLTCPEARAGMTVLVNSYGVRAFGNATAYTTAKNLVAAIALITILADASRTREGFTRPRTADHWLLRELSALTVASARMGADVVILLCWTLATHAHALTAAGWHQWSWALVTGLILAANVAATYMALARIGAIGVAAIGVAGAIITALLQGTPDTVGLALITVGAALALLTARQRPALAGLRR